MISTARRLARRAAELVLVASGTPFVGRKFHKTRILVLAYHNISPRGAAPVGDRSLHLPREVFAAQLDSLAATHEVVSLANIFERRTTAGRPRVAITFDDAYRGALAEGLPELERRGFPATIFVAPGLFGGTTWWDQLADPDAGFVPPGIREAALREYGGSAQDIIAEFGKRRVDIPGWAQIAGEAEVLGSTARPGITLGAHSWNHPNLTALPVAELRNELLKPLTWLKQVVGSRALPYLAFPYGLTSPTVASAALEAGYLGAFRIDGGWLPTEMSRMFDLPRLNVSSGVSKAGFRLRADGVVRR